MDDTKKVKVYKALADVTRLKIVQDLARKRCPGDCAELSKVSSLSQPALSHHFAKLVDAGIIIEHKKGTSKSYELNTDDLLSIGIDVSKF